jgi:hypothetical protein
MGPNRTWRSGAPGYLDARASGCAQPRLLGSSFIDKRALTTLASRTPPRGRLDFKVRFILLVPLKDATVYTTQAGSGFGPYRQQRQANVSYSSETQLQHALALACPDHMLLVLYLRPIWALV